MQNFSLAAKAFIVQDEKILLVKRRGNDATHPGLWELPGGRIGFEESPTEGIKREVREETELEIIVVMPFAVDNFTRDDGQKITGITFLCKPTKKGQKVVLSEEHTEYIWAKLEEAKRIVHKGFVDRFDIYQKILTGELFK